jgi:hypothetical protein
MATIFISYQNRDNPIAARLAARLRELGHIVRYDEELYVGAAWRDYLMEALLASDYAVVLWSIHTRDSQFVPAEVGAVRATPRMGLLPVVFGDVNIPAFLQDLLAERVPYPEEGDDLGDLARRLDAAVQKHIEHRERPRQGRPRIFISHRHKDKALVEALVDCIVTWLDVEPHDIRCTSVWPYRLPVGENTGERLRDEIADAKVVLGILGTDTLESSYVAFELGSAWGQRVWTCPLLKGGADQRHIPDPIRDLSPLFLSDPKECRQLLMDMEYIVPSLKRRLAVSGRVLSAKIDALVKAAAAPAPSPAKKARTPNMGARGDASGPGLMPLEEDAPAPSRTPPARSGRRGGGSAR